MWGVIGMKLNDAIYLRRSVRNYLEKEVKEEDILEIIKAGMQAPSAKNKRPWEFIVISNKQIIEELKTVSSGARNIENAPIVIALMIKNDASDYALEDLGACMQNMMLEATDLKLGSLWIGVAPIKENMSRARNILNGECFSLMALGYSLVENKVIDRFEEERIRYIR